MPILQSKYFVLGALLFLAFLHSTAVACDCGGCCITDTDTDLGDFCLGCGRSEKPEELPSTLPRPELMLPGTKQILEEPARPITAGFDENASVNTYGMNPAAFQKVIGRAMLAYRTIGRLERASFGRADSKGIERVYGSVRAFAQAVLRKGDKTDATLASSANSMSLAKLAQKMHNDVVLMIYKLSPRQRDRMYKNDAGLWFPRLLVLLVNAADEGLPEGIVMLPLTPETRFSFQSPAR